MSLEEVLQRADVWRGGAAPPVSGLATGFPALDALLPGGGWPSAALTEILVPRLGIGELRLLVPALARLSRVARWVVLVAPPYLPYAPALAAVGVELRRVLLIHPRTAAEGWWAVEQALRAGTASAVLAWSEEACGGSLPYPLAGEERGGEITFNILRRLQLAAEAGGSWGVVFRSTQAAAQTSAAALRLGLEPRPPVLGVRILKRRGGWPTGPIPLEVGHAVAVSASSEPAARGLHPRHRPA